jgi:hypothetical protein
MLRSDLAAAGIAVETDEGLIDFHALRGCYISGLVSGGASVKTCQTLARHSTPTLTIGVYAKASKQELAEAVGSLPDLTRGGTAPDRVVEDVSNSSASEARPLAAHWQRAGYGSGREVSDDGGPEAPRAGGPDREKSLDLSGHVAQGRDEASMGRAGIEPATPGFSGGLE